MAMTIINMDMKKNFNRHTFETWIQESCNCIQGFFLDSCESFLGGLKKGSFHGFYTGVLLGQVAVLEL